MRVRTRVTDGAVGYYGTVALLPHWGDVEMSGQHAKPKQSDRRDLRRTMTLGAAVIAVTALATAGVAGADGAVAAANPNSPYATYILGPDGATPAPTSN